MKEFQNRQIVIVLDVPTGSGKVDMWAVYIGPASGTNKGKLKVWLLGETEFYAEPDKVLSKEEHRKLGGRSVK